MELTKDHGNKEQASVEYNDVITSLDILTNPRILICSSQIHSVHFSDNILDGQSPGSPPITYLVTDF